MKRLTMLFILLISVTLISTVWANSFFYKNHCSGNGIYGGAGGAGGTGGAGGAGGNATGGNATGGNASSGATASLVVNGQNGFGDNKGEAKRGLADIVTPGGPAEARFREDDHNIKDGDWRVFKFADIISKVSVWQYPEEVKLSANMDKKKMHKNLLRVMDQKTQVIEYVPGPPTPIDNDDMVIFLGWIPMSPDLSGVV
jgi:hypothetical protein